MAESVVRLGIIGVGKVARDQHLPSIERNTNFELVAAASQQGDVSGVKNFTRIETMLDALPELTTVVLCMPPQARYYAARFALSRGLNVLLEKPPGASVSEVEALVSLSQSNQTTLFAAWHSRFASAVENAKNILSDTRIKAVNIIWHEDVTKWHAGQNWIWQAGGLGVFDAGINALSILTHLLKEPVFVTESELFFPENKASPIAANLTLGSSSDIPIAVEIDWRQTEKETWEIRFDTERGLIVLADGGARLSVNGEAIPIDVSSEYDNIYARFAKLLMHEKSDVDVAPLRLIADAFMLGQRTLVDPV